jgi:hypothetical protein
MFRIECFVEDSKLVGVLHALAGKVKAMDVQPVVNVATNTSSGKIEGATPGRMVDLYAEHLRTSNDAVNTDSVRAFLEGIGRSPTSAQHLLQEAVKHKLISRNGKGKGTTYRKVEHK